MDHKASRTRTYHSPQRAMLMAVALFATSSIVDVACAQPGGDSWEVGAIMKQYIAAWNTHDAGVLGRYFAEHADMIMGTSPILSGRAAITGWWKKYFAVQEPERKLTIKILSSIPITKDVDLINVRTTTSGTTARGAELHARIARGTWVVVHQDGKWSIAAMRGMPTEKDSIIRQ